MMQMQVVLLDAKLQMQLLGAFTEDNRLHFEELSRLLALLDGEVDVNRVVQDTVQTLPTIGRQWLLNWSDRVLAA